MRERADHIRVATFAVDNVRGASDLSEKFELDENSRIYSYTFAAYSISDPLPAFPDPVATLQLQDSFLELFAADCPRVSIRADLPGLAAPAFIKITASRDTIAILYLTYGNCDAT